MSSSMTYLYQKYSKKCLDNIHEIMQHKAQMSSKRDWRQPSVLGKCSTAKPCKSHEIHTLQQSSSHVPTHRMTSSSCSSPSPPKKACARTLLHLTVCGTNHSRDFGSMLCFGFLKSAPWPKTSSEPSLSKLNPPDLQLFIRVSYHNCCCIYGPK